MLMQEASMQAEAKQKAKERPGTGPTVVRGEPCVLAGTQSKCLLHDTIVPGSVRVRSTYLPFDRGVAVYEEGPDFHVDCVEGRLRRTDSSSIPDYSEHVFYGRDRFDLAELEDMGDMMNDRFTVYVDYVSENEEHAAVTAPERPFSFPGAGREAVVVFYGDSITFGCDATVVERSYPHHWAEALTAHFPDTQLRFHNRAEGGKPSAWGVTQLAERVCPLRPDVLVLGFGMNDQNGAHGEPGVPVPRFMENVAGMIAQVRADKACSVVLVSPCVPNPRWSHTSGTVGRFRDALAEITSRVPSCWLADVTRRWEQMLQRKAPEDLLCNNVNHPCDFGHRVYAEVLQSATLGTVRPTGAEKVSLTG